MYSYCGYFFDKFLKYQKMELEKLYGKELSKTKKLSLISDIMGIIKYIHYDFWNHHCSYIFDRLYDLSLEQLIRVHRQYVEDQKRFIKQKHETTPPVNNL